MTKDIRLGANRGNPRLWLEGRVLADAGFHRYVPFNVTLTAQSITLEIHKDGSRKVAGKVKSDGTQHPIIDMNGANLAPFANVDLLLTVTPGKIVVTRK